MQESLEAILALFRASPDERISRHSEWFTLRDAPTSRPAVYLAVSRDLHGSNDFPIRAAAGRARSARRCCRYRCRCPADTPRWRTTWQVVADQAEKSGRDEPDRDDWRVLAIMHLADSRDQAIDDCHLRAAGFRKIFRRSRFRSVIEFPLRALTSRLASSSKSMRAKAIPASVHPAMRSPKPGSARAIRRVRHPVAARPRLGIATGDLPLLRTVRREVMPPLQGPAERTAGVARLGQGMRDKLLGRAGEAIVKAINEPTGRTEDGSRKGQKGRTADARIGPYATVGWCARRCWPSRVPGPGSGARSA